MLKQTKRTYSHYNREAVQLMGKMIRLGRKEHKLTAQDLADRAGISRGLLQRIEKGDLTCAIGAVFEVAVIVGIRLFDADSSTLSRHIEQTEGKLSLLPRSVRKSKKTVDDDF